MEKRRVILQLTDITLHAKDFRQTGSYTTACERKVDGVSSPRWFSPQEKPTLPVTKDSSFEFTIKLPTDLQEAIKRGEIEVELQVPPGGLLVFLGKDAIEMITRMDDARRKKILRYCKVSRSE